MHSSMESSLARTGTLHTNLRTALEQVCWFSLSPRRPFINSRLYSVKGFPGMGLFPTAFTSCGLSGSHCHCQEVLGDDEPNDESEIGVAQNQTICGVRTTLECRTPSLDPQSSVQHREVESQSNPRDFRSTSVSQYGNVL